VKKKKFKPKSTYIQARHRRTGGKKKKKKGKKPKFETGEWEMYRLRVRLLMWGGAAALCFNLQRAGPTNRQQVCNSTKIGTEILGF